MCFDHIPLGKGWLGIVDGQLITMTDDDDRCQQQECRSKVGLPLVSRLGIRLVQLGNELGTNGQHLVSLGNSVTNMLGNGLGW